MIRKLFTSPQPRHVNPWVIAWTVMLATFMEVLDTSVANVSLPHIAGSLSAGVDESTWVLTSYLVSNAIILPITGWLSIAIGRKRFYMLCVSLFTVSSFLCGSATSLGELIFFRVLQGLGGGGLQPVSQAILVESFPRDKQGVAMAFYGVGVIFAPIIGPTLGGWITDNYTWRWIFYINIPVGALSLLLTRLLIFDPTHIREAKAGRGDYIGFGLLAVGLGFLQIVLDKGQREDWFESAWIGKLAVASVVALVLFVIWELRQEHPIVDLKLFKDRSYSSACSLMFILGVVLYGSIVLLPIYVQTLMGYTATLSGLLLSPGGVATLLTMPLIGKLSGRVDVRWMIIYGLLVNAYSLYMMSWFNTQVDFNTIMWPRIVQGLGLGALFIPINVAALAHLPKERVGKATGLINLVRNLGGSFGIAMVTTALAQRTQFHQSVLVSHITPYSPRAQEMLSGAGTALWQAGSNMVLAKTQAAGLVYGVVQQQSAMMAFVDCFWLQMLVMLGVIPLVFIIQKARGSETGLPVH
jgi:DHA2 family multidrug resistance protein